MLITRDGPAVIDANARYWLKIAVDFLPQLGGSRRNVRHNVWYGKTIGWHTKSGPFHFIATHAHINQNVVQYVHPSLHKHVYP